jgi:nucleotide-binding universal stress UspA family protein
MPGFHHILFPVDFSERSTAICSYINSFSEHFHAKVTVLHVMEFGSGGAGFDVDPSYPVMFDFQAQEPHIRRVLERRLAEHFDGVAVERVVEQGDPATCIADYAREHEVDLIMMPTHGYGKFRSLLLGSVASKVLHDADCAVWTAPHLEDPAMKVHWPCRNVLVAVGTGVAQQAPVLRRAVDLAASLGAAVRLVHAIPAAEHQPWEFGGDEFGNFLVQKAEQDVAALQATAGTTVEASVVAGGIGPVVRQVAELQNADLVIIGRGVMHEALGRLRTQSYEIIRQSPCPVLSL